MFSWSQDEEEGAKNLVKIDALFSWLKSNYGKADVAYNYNQLNEQYIWDFAEAYNQFTFNEKDYSTIVWLTDKTTTVNITNPYVDIDLTGDFHIEFTIAFNFSGTSNEAIKFTTFTYQDFSAILGRIGIQLTDAYKKKITDKYTELFANTELTSDCNKIDVLFEGIPEFVSENISGTDRVNYIKTLLSCVVNEGGWIAGKRFDTNEELALLNLFRNFSVKETPDDFLNKLSIEKVGGESLVKILVSSVDNKYLFIGDDSRKLLMIELLSLFSKTETYKTYSRELNTKLSATTVDPAYAKQLSEQTVAFDYKSIYARSWMDLKLGIVNVDPYLKIDADINSQGQVSLNSYLCYGFVSTETTDIKNPREFSPFAPIIFDQKSTLGALEGFDKVFIAPAIFAYYADKEAGIKTATDVTQAGIDVATLLIPGGQLTKLGRVFFYADKISSITSLAAGFAETNENVKNVLFGISLVTGIVSVGENIVKPSQTERLLIKSESLSKSKSVLQAEFNALVENINKLSPEELKQIEKAQENLSQFIDGYRKELGLSEDVTADAIKRLNGLTEGSGIASTLKKITGKSSLNNTQFTSLSSKLENQSFIRFDNAEYHIQTPKTFLDETNSSMYDIVLDTKYYAKYDLNDGRILLGDLDGNYYAFAQSKQKLILEAGQDADAVIRNHVIAEVNKLKGIVGLTGSKSVTLLNKAQNLSANKVNTFIGRTWDIDNIKSAMGDFKHIDLGEVSGGINILNKPDVYFNWKNWWPEHNSKWIERAVTRNDDIYIATEITTANLVNDYGPAFYAYELQALINKGIKPVNLSVTEWEKAMEIILDVLK